MKKYIAFLVISLIFTFTSCEKDTDPGGTAVKEMSGDWYVSWYEYENGEWYDTFDGYKDYIHTFNTAANVPTEMFVSDDIFLEAQIKVTSNYDQRTFEMSTPVTLEDHWYFGEDITITIKDGKVLEGAATTPRGMPADSIVFTMNIKEYDMDIRVEGFRRTGFPEDEEY